MGSFDNLLFGEDPAVLAERERALQEAAELEEKKRDKNYAPNTTLNTLQTSRQQRKGPVEVHNQLLDTPPSTKRELLGGESLSSFSTRVGRPSPSGPSKPSKSAPSEQTKKYKSAAELG